MSGGDLLSLSKHYLALLEYELACREAEDSLIAFAQFTMPQPRHMDDPTVSRYMPGAHHLLMADLMEQVERGEEQKVIINTAPRHGKQISDDTPVWTSKGWKSHGELKVGDEVFGPDGKPTKVIAVADPLPQDMEVEFTNGEVIRCHENHEWTVESQGRVYTVETKWFLAPAERGPRAGKQKRIWWGRPGSRGGRAVYQLPDTSGVEAPPAALPMDPYVFGVWLGDGTTGKPWITMTPDDWSFVSQGFSLAGYVNKHTYTHATTGVPTFVFSGPRPNVRSEFVKALEATGAYREKHIPTTYKTASIQQRLDLLAGLMDTDGHCDKAGRCRIVTSSERLANDIRDVCATLGFRPYIMEAEPTLSSSGIQGRSIVYTVGFQPTRLLPCRVHRKRGRVLANRRRIGVRDVRRSVETTGRCIQVDRADGLYLVGKTMIPTHNSELCTKRFAAWFAGRHPDLDIMVATYNEKFAQDFAKDVRDIFNSPRFKQAFPEFGTTIASTEHIRTHAGGNLYFLGRRSSTTGRGANLILVDDPTKDDKEVRYSTFREDVWQWFSQTLLTRRHNDKAAIVISQTRWHEDDVVGRITDPSNPAYSKKFHEGFKVVNLPSIAENDDPLGRKPGEALWPERFGLGYLEEMREANPVSFAALYQCDPTPDDGVFYMADGIFEYDVSELPKNLRMYCVSDHAVSTQNHNDPSVLLPFGICEDGIAWVMPQIVWRRMDANETVEEMLGLIENTKPIFWYAEKGHISKAIGPFLRKRMEETGIYCPIIEEQPVADKEQRAISARGRAAQGKIRFPKYAPWWPRAKAELLKFPNGRFDDFVDCISMIGLKLVTHTGPGKATEVREKDKPGTYGHLLKQFREEDEARKAAARRAGW